MLEQLFLWVTVAGLAGTIVTGAIATRFAATSVLRRSAVASTSTAAHAVAVARTAFTVVAALASHF